MADGFERATRQTELARDMKIFAKAFMQKFQEKNAPAAKDPHQH
jgi:hypothetical protein